MTRIIFFFVKIFCIISFFSPALLAFDLEGRVKLKPPYPDSARLEVDEKHQAECGKEKVSPKLKISSEGGVANAVVKVEGAPGDGGDGSPQSLMLENRPHILDQINCEFSPHVLLIPAGAELSILNSEAMLHNVRAFDESARMLFNVAMPKKGQVLKKTL